MAVVAIDARSESAYTRTHSCARVGLMVLKMSHHFLRIERELVEQILHPRA